MPGCGKSTIGRQLARLRELSFWDVDHEIERQIGGSIRDYFEQAGEPAFRDLEQRTLADLLASLTSGVVATGGGAVLRAENRVALRRHSTVLYLRAMPDDLARRLSRDTQRPLLQVADPRQRLRDLFAVRDPLYRDTAHVAIDTGHRSAATVAHLAGMQIDMFDPDGRPGGPE